MYFTKVKLFQYSFFFCPGEGTGFFCPGEGTGEPTSFDTVKDWCNENITGQWLIFDNSDKFSRQREIMTTFYSRAIHSSPINEGNYPPAEIEMPSICIFAFEFEEDAAAFKLRWDQVNVC